MNEESLKINESLRKHLREIREIIRNECELRGHCVAEECLRRVSLMCLKRIEDAVKSMEELIETNKEIKK